MWQSLKRVNLIILACLILPLLTSLLEMKIPKVSKCTIYFPFISSVFFAVTQKLSQVIWTDFS